MKTLMVSICLNEAEWIERHYLQHRDWPGMEGMVYVEGADRMYAVTNPTMVTPEGLSVDGTTELLAGIAATDSRVTHIRHGLMTHPDPAQGKCAGRNAYLDVAGRVKPDWLVVADVDEFYSTAAQRGVNDLLTADRRPCHGVMLRQRHIWFPPGARSAWDRDHPGGVPVDRSELFAHEATGGYWSVPHCRLWRWCEGVRYVTNHNNPYEHPIIYRLDREPGTPELVHMGFASAPAGRAARHAYYVARGEGNEKSGRNRQDYVDCRHAWEVYRPGDRLPHGAVVVKYSGEVPEVFS